MEVGISGLLELDLSECASLKNGDGLPGLTGLQEVVFHDTFVPDGRQPKPINGCKSLPASALRALRTALPKTKIIFPDGTTNPP